MYIIKGIQAPSGAWVRNFDGMTRVVTSFYCELFKSNILYFNRVTRRVEKCVTNEMNQVLTREFSEKDIK